MSDYKDKNGTTRVGDFLRGLKNISPEILDIAGLATGVEGLSVLAEKIRGSDSITPLDKELALKRIELDIEDAKETSKRWSSDMVSDSWLSKNIRPLILAYLTLATTIYIVLDSSLVDFEIKEHWVTLLSSLLLLVFGGYFGARTVEKIYKIKK